VTEIIFGDAARNWFFVACVVAAASLIWSLGEGSFLRKGLVNLLVGVPASLWMLATAGGVSAGGSMPLLFALALVLGHAGVAAANLLAASSSAVASSSGELGPVSRPRSRSSRRGYLYPALLRRRR